MTEAWSLLALPKVCDGSREEFALSLQGGGPVNLASRASEAGKRSLRGEEGVLKSEGGSGRRMQAVRAWRIGRACQAGQGRPLRSGETV